MREDDDESGAINWLKLGGDAVKWGLKLFGGGG